MSIAAGKKVQIRHLDCIGAASVRAEWLGGVLGHRGLTLRAARPSRRSGRLFRIDIEASRDWDIPTSLSVCSGRSARDDVAVAVDAEVEGGAADNPSAGIAVAVDRPDCCYVLVACP